MCPTIPAWSASCFSAMYFFSACRFRYHWQFGDAGWNGCLVWAFGCPCCTSYAGCGTMNHRFILFIYLHGMSHNNNNNNDNDNDNCYCHCHCHCYCYCYCYYCYYPLNQGQAPWQDVLRGVASVKIRPAKVGWESSHWGSTNLPWIPHI